VIYFYLDESAARKRVIFPIFTIALSATFVGLSIWLGGNTTALAVLAVAVAAMTAINIYKVRFCDQCGATVGLSRRGILPDKNCPRCGAPLQ
jgi:ribosomal protein S27AE